MPRSPHHPVTIAHLIDGRVLWIEVTCLDCPHVASVPTVRFPAGLLVADLPRRLRCSRCGSRRVRVRPDWRHSVVGPIPRPRIAIGELSSLPDGLRLEWSHTWPHGGPDFVGIDDDHPEDGCRVYARMPDDAGTDWRWAATAARRNVGTGLETALHLAVVRAEAAYWLHQIREGGAPEPGAG